jgi:DNA primase
VKIPDVVIEAIKDRVDIVQAVGRYVQLKRAGRNHVGLCPFHSEKTPSFNVSPERKIFHCFGCGEGGDVFKFLGKIQNQSFPEVARALAKEAGVEVPEREETAAEREAHRLRQRILAIQERALHWFIQQLKGVQGGGRARTYLQERGLDERGIAEFEVGFGGMLRDGLWGSLGQSEEDKQDLVRAGLCVVSERGVHDRFSGRVIFPIRDERFQVVGFGGRVFGEKASRKEVPKYLNSPESVVYDKSQALYRLPQAIQKARKGEAVVLVEGYFDAIALERCGMAAVASCGTSLTARHGHALQKLKVPVVVCWDGDAAGQRAVQRAAQVLLPLKIDTRMAVLPVGDDPDTYAARVGVAGAQRLVKEAEPLPMWVIAQAARAMEETGDDVPRRAAAIRSLAWLFHAVPEGLERDLYLEQAAKRLGLERGRLAKELHVAAHAPANQGLAGTTSAQARPPVRKPMGPPPLTAQERTLARLVLEQPELAAALEEAHQGAHTAEVVRSLLASSRDLVHGHGTFFPGEPLWLQLRERAGHPDLVRIMDEIATGTRVFADEGAAEHALQDLLAGAEFGRLKMRERELQAELEAVHSDLEKARQVQEPLRVVRSRLRELEPRAGRTQSH